jgi:hypothetical protein
MTQERLFTFYRGRPIQELSREELLAALEDMIVQYTVMQKRWLKADEDKMEMFFDLHTPNKNIS